MTAPATHVDLRGVDRRWLVLIPVASIMYVLAFLDRTNISFVLPQMSEELGLTGSEQGLVTGIFFVGYLVLQVPAALAAQRWSAKKTIVILMLAWGVAAVASGLVRSSEELLVARFVLGVFEGGVQPATLVLLARWFLQRERARANALWLACLPLSSLIAAPLTGTLLEFMSWRGVLILQGAPPILWAVVWWFVIADKPSDARWLPSGRAGQVERGLEADEAAKGDVGSARYRDVFRNPRVWGLIVFWFLFNAGFYGFTLWLPTVVSDLSGGSSSTVGWLTAIPYALALVGMITIAVVSDRTGSRRWAIALPVLVSATALATGQFVDDPVAQFVLLCIVASTLYVHGPFLALPAVVLRLEVLALALGVINGLGNLGGFVGPYVVGALIDATGSTTVGFLGLSGAFVVAAGVVLALVPRDQAARRGTAEADRAPGAEVRR